MSVVWLWMWRNHTKSEKKKIIIICDRMQSCRDILTCHTWSHWNARANIAPFSVNHLSRHPYRPLCPFIIFLLTSKCNTMSSTMGYHLSNDFFVLMIFRTEDLFGRTLDERVDMPFTEKYWIDDNNVIWFDAVGKRRDQILECFIGNLGIDFIDKYFD